MLFRSQEKGSIADYCFILEQDKMGLRKQLQKTGEGGALVPAYSSAGVRKPSGLDHLECATPSKSPENSITVAARSVFLAQLVAQYESKSAAGVRRMEARACASSCYGAKIPKPALRHLVWA